MNQYDFDLLLQKYLAGECSPSEQQQILDWSENMLQTSRVAVSTFEKERIRKRIWKRLRSARRPAIYHTHWFKAGLAACILGLLIYGWAAYLGSPVLKKTSELATLDSGSSQGTIQVKNTTDGPYKVILEDGSAVILKPESTIHYPKHFSEKARIVLLSGEAFFDVSKNPKRPFFVYTGELITRVLGTSFTVKSFNSAKSVEVSVVTGRVSVYENTKKTAEKRNGIILSPNQKIRFDSQVKTLVPELVEEPVMVYQPQKKESFIFEETPLAQVIARIQQVYGIEIVLESAAMEPCVFTGDLNELSLHSKLRMVCKSVNATYELRGTTLFINGDGCNN